MSVAKEKKFVIRHTFINVLHIERVEPQYSPRENHFNVDWCVYIHETLNGDFEVGLKCPSIIDNENCQIYTDILLKMKKNTGEEELFADNFVFAWDDERTYLTYVDSADELEGYLINGNLTVEFHVEILEMTGIKKEFTVSEKFDGSIKELWDVMLIINDKKFHVMKQYLAFHSSYFKSLFFGNFDESKKSEVELKDIDPEDFQNYLNLVHAETLVNDDTVNGILKLADFFDSKTAIERCEELLMGNLKNSQKTLKEKFELAIKYKLDNLMEKCFSDITTTEDIRSILPKDMKTLDPELANKLLLKSLSLRR